MAIGLAVAALSACGGDGDAPQAEVAVTIDCAPASAWRFPETAIGQTSSVVVLATSTAAGALPTPTLDGADAAAFHINLDDSTCDDARALAINDTCVIIVELTPAAARTHRAALHVGPSTIALDATAVERPSGLVASVGNVAAIHGFYDVASLRMVRVTNEGSRTAMLGTLASTTDGMQVTQALQCPATLAPGRSCELTVSTGQLAAGCATARIQLTSNLGTLEIPVSSRRLGGVAIRSFAGHGTGRVVSSPAGIDCAGVAMADGSLVPTGACEHPFDSPVTLTATPDASNHFNGWVDLRCGQAETCVVDPATPPTDGGRVLGVVPAFASPQARAIDVTFAGGGIGTVTGAVSCAASCRGWVEDGAAAALTATTPSLLTGWSGACAGTDPRCDLGAVSADRAVTVTFEPNPGEVATLLPDFAGDITRGQITSDGDLVVAYRTATEVQVARLSPSGELRWSHALRLDEAASVKLADTGEIYVLGHSLADPTQDDLIQLGPAGDEVWRRAVPQIQLSHWEDPSMLAVGADRVAVLGEDTLRVLTAGGAVLWSAPTTQPAVLAIDSRGTIAVLSRAGVVTWFAPDGAALPQTWSLADGEVLRAAMVFDAQDQLVVQTRSTTTFGVSHRAIAVFSQTGTTVFAHPISDPGAALTSDGPGSGGVALLAGQRLVSWMPHVYQGFFAFERGVRIETYDAAGAATLQLDKTPGPTASGQPDAGITPRDLACNRAGRCAMFGTYVAAQGTPWISVFELP